MPNQARYSGIFRQFQKKKLGYVPVVVFCRPLSSSSSSSRFFSRLPLQTATPFFSLLLGRHFALHHNFFLGIYGWIFLCCSGNFLFFEKLFWNSRYLPLSVFVILKNCLELWMTTTAIFLRSEEVALLLHSWRRSSLHKVSWQYALTILHRCSSLLLFSSRFGFVACFFSNLHWHWLKFESHSTAVFLPCIFFLASTAFFLVL